MPMSAAFEAASSDSDSPVALPSDATDTTSASEPESEVGMEIESQDEESDSEVESEAQESPEKDAFTSAVSSILGSRVKKYSRDNPVLLRNQKSAQALHEAKLDARARRALKAEQRQKKDKARVKQVVPSDPEEAGTVLARERNLRRLAQRGVVRLLNAISASRTAAISAQSSGPGVDKKERRAHEVSKSAFLELIREG